MWSSFVALCRYWRPRARQAAAFVSSTTLGGTARTTARKPVTPLAPKRRYTTRFTGRSAILATTARAVAGAISARTGITRTAARSWRVSLCVTTIAMIESTPPRRNWYVMAIPTAAATSIALPALTGRRTSHAPAPLLLLDPMAVGRSWAVRARMLAYHLSFCFAPWAPRAGAVGVWQGVAVRPLAVQRRPRQPAGHVADQHVADQVLLPRGHGQGADPGSLAYQVLCKALTGGGSRITTKHTMWCAPLSLS